MFKLLKWAVVLVLLLVVGGVIALYLSLGGIVKRVVEKEGTAQLNVPTTLGAANVGLTSGSIGFTNFAVGSPAGFTAPQLLTVGGLKVDTAGVTHLRDKPLHVTNIDVTSPRLVIEQKGLKVNIKELMNGLPKTGEASPKTADQNPTKLIIDTLTITNSTVDFIPDAGSIAGGAVGNVLGGLGNVGEQASALAQKQAGKAVKPMTLTLPSITVNHIGDTDGKGQGAEVKDVAVAVIQAMAAAAAKDHNIPIDPALLGGDFSSVKDKGADLLKKQTDKLPGGVGDFINKGLGGK